MAGETVITVVGNLTADPELRFTPSGAAVANFTVASTPRTFDRQSGEWKDGEARAGATAARARDPVVGPGRQRTLERELEWIRMSPRARQAKSKARISAYETLLAQSDTLEAQLLAANPRLDRWVVESHHLTVGVVCQQDAGLFEAFAHRCDPEREAAVAVDRQVLADPADEHVVRPGGGLGRVRAGEQAVDRSRGRPRCGRLR